MPAVAVAAVAMGYTGYGWKGVALAFSVHLINESALGEFSAAVRQVNGQPDFELRAQREGFDEALFARVATQPGVALASAVIELDAQALDGAGQPVPLRVIGLDALAAAPLTPALLPRPAEGADRLAVIDPTGEILAVNDAWIAFAERAAADEDCVVPDGPERDIGGAQAGNVECEDLLRRRQLVHVREVLLQQGEHFPIRSATLALILIEHDPIEGVPQNFRLLADVLVAPVTGPADHYRAQAAHV